MYLSDSHFQQGFYIQSYLLLSNEKRGQKTPVSVLRIGPWHQTRQILLPNSSEQMTCPGCQVNPNVKSLGSIPFSRVTFFFMCWIQIASHDQSFPIARSTCPLWKSVVSATDFEAESQFLTGRKCKVPRVSEESSV